MLDTIRKRFGLLGRNISYSFSKGYFTEKFNNDKLFEGCTYENFDIPEITSFPEIIKNTPDLKGMNVTIPYKEVVIPYLDKLSEKATEIGAVNTIKFTNKKALILGTGGASKGVAYALKELGILYTFVSREAKEGIVDYDRINATTFDNYQIIINSTPVGTSPNVEAFPLIPYEYFNEKHIAYDLIYNPAETQFLKKAAANGAQTKNGQDMLVFQAEKAWKIWNK